MGGMPFLPGQGIVPQIPLGNQITHEQLLHWSQSMGFKESIAHLPPPTITARQVTSVQGGEVRIMLDDSDRQSVARLVSNTFTKAELAEWFTVAYIHTPWTNPATTDRDIPRLVSWITNPGCSCHYVYSGAHT